MEYTGDFEMRIDINRYKGAKATTQRWYINKDNKIPDEDATMMGVVTHTPIIVIAFWIGEVDGWSNEILDLIDLMVKTYRYDTILNIPEGYPGSRK
jgi:hypothetical protein